MKSLKYIIISLLVVTICKRITPSSEVSDFDKSELAQKEMESRLTQTAEEDTTKQKKTHTKRFKSTVKKYNPNTKTATVDNIYVGVYEYKQAMTPPNITIPAMVPFGTITEHYSSKNKDFDGGKLAIKTLWGIPVIGHRLPIKELDKNLTIGYLWTSQDLSLGVAQMNKGATFVGVKNSHQPNYVSPGSYGPGGIGPVWTWYTAQEAQELEQKYGISKPSSDTIKEIGIAKINRQRYKLYGIELADLDNPIETKITAPTLFNSKSMPTHTLLNNLRTNPLAAKYNEEDLHPLIFNLLAKYWHDHKKE